MVSLTEVESIFGKMVLFIKDNFRMEFAKVMAFYRS